MAAIKWIIEDHASGVSYPEPVLSSLEEIPVIVFGDWQGDTDLRQAALLGIRHVSGPKAWGAYQAAQIIVEMKDIHGLPTQEVASRLGLRPTEVTRRYRAYRALEQMENHEEFGHYARPQLFALFHEAIANVPIKDWLGWNEQESRFDNAASLELFYGLISPSGDEDPQPRAKITTYQEVRELRNIVGHPEAYRVLVDNSKSFMDALVIARQGELSKSWIQDIINALRALKAMGIEELKQLDQKSLQLLERLETLVKERISDYRRVSGEDGI